MIGIYQDPPRNGEGDHAQHGGGVEARMRHRTVGATDENISLARKLRKRMSLPEVLLWRQLRQQPDGLRFRRQYPIEGYAVDFACLSRRLAIEIDGEAHGRGNRPRCDAKRDSVLAELGFYTLRLAARDVLNNLDGALALIIRHCVSRPLHQPAAGPPPRSGEDLR